MAKSSIVHALQDLSIHDYADNPRIRKGFNRVKKSLIPKNALKYAPEPEQDLCEAQDDEDGDEFVQLTRPEMPGIRASKNRQQNIVNENKTNYRDFPMEVWTEIGMRIEPLDIRKFALICSKSYAVSKTRSFWKGIYTRQLKFRLDLPEDITKCPQYLLRLLVVQNCCKLYRSLQETCTRDLTYLRGKICTIAYELTKHQNNGKPAPTLRMGFFKEGQDSCPPVVISDPKSAFGNNKILVEPIYHKYVFLEVSSIDGFPPYSSILNKRLVHFTESSVLSLTFSSMLPSKGKLCLYQGDACDVSIYSASYKVINWWDDNFPSDFITRRTSKSKDDESNVPDSWEDVVC